MPMRGNFKLRKNMSRRIPKSQTQKERLEVPPSSQIAQDHSTWMGVFVNVLFRFERHDEVNNFLVQVCNVWDVLGFIVLSVWVFRFLSFVPESSLFRFSCIFVLSFCVGCFTCLLGLFQAAINCLFMVILNPSQT
jgi:hypothetical protein